MNYTTRGGLISSCMPVVGMPAIYVLCLGCLAKLPLLAEGPRKGPLMLHRPRPLLECFIAMTGVQYGSKCAVMVCVYVCTCVYGQLLC